MAKLIRAAATTLVMAIAILHPTGITGADKVPEKTKSITVGELSNLEVIGGLGHPFGKIVTIEGVVADEDYRKLKGDLGHRLLRIHSVDGKKLAEEQIFHFSPFAADLEKPKVGSKFKYIGYETGGFNGLPTKAFDYVGLIAIPGYGFKTEFVVLRDEAMRK
jgi:hypothetical protein